MFVWPSYHLFDILYEVALLTPRDHLGLKVGCAKSHGMLKYLSEVLLEQAVHPGLGYPGRPALVGDVARLDEDALEDPHVVRTAEVEPGIDFGLEVGKDVVVVGHVGGQDEVGNVLRIEILLISQSLPYISTIVPKRGGTNDTRTCRMESLRFMSTFLKMSDSGLERISRATSRCRFSSGEVGNLAARSVFAFNSYLS